MADCLFCRIIQGEVPSKKVYEDDYTFAFEDLNPQGPTHVLIVPKKHIAGLKEATAGDAEIVGRCHLTAARIARQRSIEDGYRTVLNVGPRSGQSVFHLCTSHLIGGRSTILAAGSEISFPFSARLSALQSYDGEPNTGLWLRLLPADEVAEVQAATIKLKNGREAHVTMHVLEGSKDEIEKQLKTSLSAFFDIYPEI